MEINIEIKTGFPVTEQSQLFQVYFNQNFSEKINFNTDSQQTCSTLDDFGRPQLWKFDEFDVKAEYFTQDINFTFKQFIIIEHGTI